MNTVDITRYQKHYNMYTDKNITYSDAGKYLIYKNQIGFQFPSSEDIMEYDVNLDDLYIKGNTAYYNSGTLAQNIIKNSAYGDYKSAIIKKRYSNDDQIAIMLNKDDSEEDRIRYERMMQWRKFAAELAKKIINNI